MAWWADTLEYIKGWFESLFPEATLQIWDAADVAMKEAQKSKLS